MRTLISYIPIIIFTAFCYLLTHDMKFTFLAAMLYFVGIKVEDLEEKIEQIKGRW